MGELPLRSSVSRDSIRQIFWSAEAGYNATLVPIVLGLGAPRRPTGYIGPGPVPFAGTPRGNRIGTSWIDPDRRRRYQRRLATSV